MLEADNAVEFPSVGTCIEQPLLHRHVSHLGDGKSLCRSKDFTVHLLENVVNAFAVGDQRTEGCELGVSDGQRRIRQTVGFAQQIDGIKPKTVHPLAQPVAHHAVHFFPYPRIPPIQIGLFA
ncbi:hypothetical protein D3C81_1672130 [compost metagenome]